MTDSRAVRYIITADVTDAESGMFKLERQTTKTANELEKTGRKLQATGAGMSSFGHKLTQLSLPIVALGAYAVKSAVSFQSSMTMIQTQAGASAKEVSQMSGAILKMRGVGEGPQELANALYPIESVGLRGTKALEALRASAKGAQVSGAGLTETADAMAGALKVGLPDITNAASAMSAMNAVVGYGKMHLNDLTEAMGTRVLTSAKQVGLGFRDVGSALDAMTTQNISAQTEATALRLTFTQMTAPTGVALRALHRIGLGQFSLADDLRKPKGLIVALRDLRAHLSNLPKDQQTLAISEAFGKSRGSSNVIGLLNALPTMEGISAKLAQTGEAALNKAFGARQHDAAFRMAEAVAQLKKALTQLGEVLIPVVIPALVKVARVAQSGIEVFKKLPTPVRDTVLGFAALLAIGGPLLIFFGSIISTLGQAMGALGKLQAAMGGAAAAAEGETAAFGAAGGLLGGALAAGFAAALLLGVPKVLHKLIELINPGYLKKHSINEIESQLATGFPHKLPNLGAGHGQETAGVHRIGPRMTPVEQAIRARQTRVVDVHGVDYYLHPGETTKRINPAGEEINLNVYLDGEQITSHVVKQVRNKPQHARGMSEAVTKHVQHRTAREGTIG
jgi:TP901 family phage tail tape measure protein